MWNRCEEWRIRLDCHAFWGANLCRELDIKMIAEGIETIEERDTLVRLGGDLCQGYLFARPGRAFPTVKFDTP